MLHTVYLGLGSNLGQREAHIRQALCLIEERIGRVVRCSSLIETAPWGYASPNRFINACAACSTHLTPEAVLLATQQIERDMGRRRKSTDGIYHDRIIDIDILLYDRLILNTESLILPHPHMFEREFVMIPLREIYPDEIIFGAPETVG